RDHALARRGGGRRAGEVGRTGKERGDMVQVAFLTLFLGLTSGKQEIAVAVRGPAAAVELMLDGTAVVRMGGPPWRTKVDLGPALTPHELVARALDAQGQEVAR